ncbi:MAG: PepSY-associated TM helix domain-containing protein [Verrucomicrobiales bacterium]|nr:PepSY-associated TM helix domain-containing protein [Verrucomicrobiales bacterium]
MNSESTQSRGRVRRWLLNIHLYGGLVCCWYLLIYGVTSLDFNHPGFLPEARGEKVKWERALNIPDLADNVKLGEAIRDELDLVGWVIPWNMRRDGAGDLQFELSRPGKNYVIATDRAAGKVRVEEQHTGLRSALHSLHGNTEGVPGSRFMHAWNLYTEVTNWLVLFFAGSGIYLWVRRERARRLALGVLLGSLAVSVGLMAYLYFIG